MHPANTWDNFIAGPDLYGVCVCGHENGRHSARANWRCLDCTCSVYLRAQKGHPVTAAPPATDDRVPAVTPEVRAQALTAAATLVAASTEVGAGYVTDGTLREVEAITDILATFITTGTMLRRPQQW